MFKHIIEEKNTEITWYSDNALNNCNIYLFAINWRKDNLNK